jgi:hypothetical protein
MRKMKTKICKITAFLLAMLLSVGLLVGCGQGDDEAFVKDVVVGLLADTEIVNAMCFGEGIRPSEEGYSSGGYVEANPEDLAAFGVSSVLEMREMVRKVYSVTTADWVEDIAFSAIHADNTVLRYSRYYDTVASEEEGDRAVVMVKTDYEPLLFGRNTYANVRLTEKKAKRAKILVDVTVTYEGETRVMNDVSLTLRLEEDGWRFDGPTYFSFTKE